MTEAVSRPGTDVGVTVARWCRYGHDRLYVKDAAGTDLGYWDLKADQPRPAAAEWLDVVTTAAAGWRAERTRPAAPLPPVVATPIRPPAPFARPWIDLATSAPGEAVRERAAVERDAAPVRSLLGRVFGVRTEETSWRLGAEGEEKVGRQLAKLTRKDPRWRVLHSIPVGARGSDIDHLVIGPGGVFTVNAKHHRGAQVWVGGDTFLVNGYRQPYVRNARHEAERAGRLLSAACGEAVAVQGLIVPVNAGELTIRSQPCDVYVVPRMQLTGWLLRLGPFLEEPSVLKIYEAARRSTTWS